MDKNAYRFQQFMLAKSQKDESYANYNHAAQKLEVRQIEERLAEVRSQTDPIAESIARLGVDKNLENLIRMEIEHFCRYVVTGRKDREV
jgi:hypothetical protein